MVEWGNRYVIYEYGVVYLQAYSLAFSVYSKNTFDSYSFEIAAFTTTAFDMYPCRKVPRGSEGVFVTLHAGK